MAGHFLRNWWRITAPYLIFSSALLALFPSGPAALPAGFIKTVVASGLDVSFLTAVNDGRLFVNEKHGTVRVIKDDVLLPAPLLDISSQVESAVERGLLGIAVDPNFIVNGYLYLFHNDKDNHAYISRFTVKGDVADPASVKKIFDLGVHGAPYHHGGDLQFGPDGKLYFTQGNGAGYLGDAGTVSQNKNDLLGSIMRINPDGTIPADNPFYATNGGDARAVWTYGNRNTFNVRFQPGTGLVYFSDVMDNNVDDEINEGKAGGNYGYGGGSGTIEPLVTYGAGGAAQIGGAWYAATQFPTEYRGLFFFGNSGNGNLKTIDPKTHKVTTFDALTNDCPISLDVGAQGALYASTRCGDGPSVINGKVYKFTYPAGVTGLAQGGFPPPTERVMESPAFQGHGNGQSQGVSVKLLQDGLQSLELVTVDGRLLERHTAHGAAQVDFSSIPGKGLFFLVWRNGSRKVITKLFLD